MTSRSGSCTGSGLRISALTREKIATLAPMPSASESSATPLTIGVCRIWRTANLRSRTSEDTNPMRPFDAQILPRLARIAVRLVPGTNSAVLVRLVPGTNRYLRRLKARPDQVSSTEQTL